MTAAAATATAADKKPEEGEKPVVAGELLYCGGTQFDTMGHKTPASSSNLVSPTRLRPLVGVDIRFVASGCTACHCLALDVDGRCFTWGRNEKGQLGHGDTLQRNLPMIVSKLSAYNTIRASVGRKHTVVVTDASKSFSFGMNKHGQLGSGSMKNEIEKSPVPCLVTDATNVACGSDFTVWLSSVEGSTILTAGLPQFGQLGQGTDNEYNTKDSSVKLAYEAQPRPRAISTLSGKTKQTIQLPWILMASFTRGALVATEGIHLQYRNSFCPLMLAIHWVMGVTLLGHREAKDEWVPRLVEVFQKYNILPPTAVVSAGATSSACTAGGGQLYRWGKIKNSGGDDLMYPKANMDLSGWNIRCMASGYFHHVVGADQSCISWGHAQYGQLGYGPLGQKSSANPKKIDILDGMHVLSVGCGNGLSLIVVDRARAGDKLDQLEIYDGEAAVVEAEENGKVNASSKPSKKPAPKSPANSNKRKKDSSESEADEDDSSVESDGKKPKRGGKSAGRGQGRGAKKGNDSTPKRGRGCPKSSEEEISSGRGRGRGNSGKTAKSRK